MSQTSVSLIWRAFSLQPHRAESFKLSTDPLFVDKVKDIVGLYLDPPERAVVLCLDEKSQIQALNRFTPILPMMVASVWSMTPLRSHPPAASCMTQPYEPRRLRASEDGVMAGLSTSSAM